MTRPVVTRFAPSPTGFLHIGGGRTALFNWLYARKHGGTMLLRIEDTDRQRSTQEAIDAILDGLKWLGIDWDGDTVYQFARAARHREVAEQLLAAGKAYRCYATTEELAAMRDKARAEGRAKLYDGSWRDRDPSEAPEGVKPTIRLKAPLTGETVIEDQVQGRVAWQNENLDDLVLLRGDGTPTYMLAVVVDDHDMGVTHVIRGDDHLINAARQKQIYDAMEWELPVMAHIPLIHGPDGSKLSKRHGALGVDAYRAMGYLPAALRNYLVRLGWSHGDQEIFTTQEMIDAFDLPAIGRSAARFDFAKLESLNGHYIRQSDDHSLVTLLEDLLKYIPQGPAIAAKFDDSIRAKLTQAMPGLKERAKTLIELLDNAGFIFADRPLALDPKAQAVLTPETRQLIGRLRAALEDVTPWTAATTEAAMRTFAEQAGLKLGAVAQPLRVALTGRTTSPGIFDVLAVLGRDECLSRLADQAA
ncbi:glutamate--tRNA ligase [Rhodopseudomonas palustris]|jgi:glutamyl-tRNA synthetase|uniref:glutamate--tRNA ligase n=1 Tax=Rhodopseudomonas TaxID=1073 RepID=UPI0013DFA144|nr:MULTISPECIES: glutamate--tRNA ligase [Rhodopseudomonas]NEW96578.1 glutamate--tRNA ligase [Rhodopseudomonas sp. BR0G17]UYO42676.1 glutamate--tRNA ligase [Rhodopseudomonas palustris]